MARLRSSSAPASLPIPSPEQSTGRYTVNELNSGRGGSLPTSLTRDVPVAHGLCVLGRSAGYESTATPPR